MERGRSLSELGRSMTWSDLRAFIRYLPADSHFRREEEPEETFKVAWLEQLATPQMAVLGEMFDLMQVDLLARAGQEPTVQKILSQLAARVIAPAEGEDRPAVEPKRTRKGKTAAEIRAQVERAYKKK